MAVAGQAVDVKELKNFSLGYNGYSNPSLLTPTFWKSASNIYSGPFAYLRKIRFANVVVDGVTAVTTVQNASYLSLYAGRDPTTGHFLLGDVGTKQYAFDPGNSYAAMSRVNPMNPSGSVGPWSRVTLNNICLEMNGTVKQSARGNMYVTVEGFGLDTPDTSPGVTLAAGSITKTVGRSYRFAWENANNTHIGAPSPATSYIAYSSQQGTIECVQPGTVSTISGTKTVTGSGTAFTSAWVGRYLWVAGIGSMGRIASVASATSLTLDNNALATVSGQKFTPFDPQATHIRGYATSDGGSVYYRLWRNSFNAAATTLASAGLSFVDNTNAEPPNSPWTSEQPQYYNVPPPIGKWLGKHQGHCLVYGVDGFEQTLFYSNVSLTDLGIGAMSFAPLNTITFPIGDSELNGHASLPTGLIVWSNTHDMFKITGTLTDNTLLTGTQQGASVVRLPYELGIANPRAVTVTPLGAIWLTNDLEVRLYNDVYAPKNIGQPIQDVLDTANMAQLSNAQMSYYHTKEKQWVVLALAVNGSGYNNKLLVLDLNMLASNGQPSYYIFDMATNQPAWYLFDIRCDSIGTSYDATPLMHLFCGQNDKITDADWDGSSFKQGAALTPSASITTHPDGNETSTNLKRLKWMRLNTNRTSAQLITDGWAFAIEVIDDDVYSPDSPQVVSLTPGVDSPDSALASEYSAALFKFGADKFVQGRGLRYSITFPNSDGDYRLYGIQRALKLLPAR